MTSQESLNAIITGLRNDLSLIVDTTDADKQVTLALQKIPLMQCVFIKLLEEKVLSAEDFHAAANGWVQMRTEAEMVYDLKRPASSYPKTVSKWAPVVDAVLERIGSTSTESTSH